MEARFACHINSLCHYRRRALPLDAERRLAAWGRLRGGRPRGETMSAATNRRTRRNTPTRRHDRCATMGGLWQALQDLPLKILVTGAGGFIGYHLTRRLKAEGHFVRGVDLKPPEYATTPCDDFRVADLRDFDNCVKAVDGIDDVYQLAADMGGIGHIALHHALLARHNALIDSHMLEAARLAAVRRYLYTSSACVYPSFLQESEDVSPLREDQAIPADPERGYGWEKLFAEHLADCYRSEYRLDARVVRLHNIYGPYGTYDGGREKAPAAICRKVALARDGSGIVVWGDGLQTRSFCYVDDCVEGMRRLMEREAADFGPLNLGSDEIVTVNELVAIVGAVAGKRLRTEHDLSRPQGVRGRNSDNARLKSILGWAPDTSLRDGIGNTYPWIAAQVGTGSTGAN